ncbi:hypothetical protein GCM10022252_41050 [Streptosporangium oxazolinicum]|uniref:Uncharacterized protein n=1 Tax=Streptosporangium oxazolinicum TaxID=909287 RepID=A0ABP8B0V7_9ACTN
MSDLYLGGTRRDPVAGGHREIRSPADGGLVATVSGTGREPGPAGYRKTRHVWQNVRPRPRRWFRS